MITLDTRTEDLLEALDAEGTSYSHDVSREEFVIDRDFGTATIALHAGGFLVSLVAGFHRVTAEAEHTTDDATDAVSLATTNSPEEY